MRFDREFYRPKGSRVESPKDLPDGYEVHRYERAGVVYAAVFGGKRSKPDWHYRFKSAERMEEKIAEWVESQKEYLERKKQDRKERYAPHGFEVGQVFYCSWGYDQCNINFYKLVELKGKTMGRIVPITGRLVSSNPPCDRVVAGDEVREWDVLLSVKKEDEDKGVWKRLSKTGFSPSRGYHAGPDSGESHYETSAGWGH